MPTEMSCPALDALLAQFGGAPELLAALLEQANTQIEEHMREVLTQLYGPRLTQRWQMETTVNSGDMLAMARVFTDDPYVRGFEFGTRPHPIYTRIARALAFQWGGNQAFFAHVNHPGTPAHDRRSDLQTDLGAIAGEAWTTALTEALSSITGA